MADVFVCYSRRDRHFVRRLINHLHQAHIDSWVDWEGIPLSASNWWEEIKTGIAISDTFLFIMSPSSMASIICNMELSYAMELQKRIIPVVYEEVVSEDAFASIAGLQPDAAMNERLSGRDPLELARDNWQNISHINWLFFRDSDDFESSANQLINAVEEDPEYIKLHTKYTRSAHNWDSDGRSPDYLLRGKLAIRAYEWLQLGDNLGTRYQSRSELGSSDFMNPLPTELQRQFILESHQLYRRETQTLTTRIRKYLLQFVPSGPKKVFLSYRRADSAYACGRIYDRLVPTFKPDNVFLDVDTIDFGADFTRFIQDSLAECFAVLAIIGPDWVEMLRARAESGEEDFVRIELESALKRYHVNVIPILVGGASMPVGDDLLPSIRSLTKRNGTTIRPGPDFHRDMDKLIDELKSLRQKTKSEI